MSPRAAALAEIEALARRGVEVNSGSGTRSQRLGVHACQGLLALVFAAHVWSNPWLLPALPAVVVVIDVLSGAVHWFFDTRILPGPTPLGRIAVDFLDHHVRPARTGEVSFVVSARRAALYVSTPLARASLALDGWPVLQAVVFWTGALALYGPQTHKYTHTSATPTVVRLAQRLGLMLVPAAHHRHHADHTRAYCVFTGWANPLLDGMAFWQRLGRWCDRLSGRESQS
jgi:hypothetical protein